MRATDDDGGGVEAHDDDTVAGGGREAHDDEKVARAKALIEKVKSAPRQRRGGERRAAEQRNDGGQVAGGGVLQGLVVAVTGNFDKTRPEVDALVKAQNAVYSGTVHKRVDYLICCPAALESRTKHVRKAEKFGTKIVPLAFLDLSIQEAKLADPTAFILTPPPPPPGDAANVLVADVED